MRSTTGWIAIFRSLNLHWINDNNEELACWIKILLQVNYEPKQVSIGNRILTVERGESVNSHETWAKIFGGDWNRYKVGRFFKKLVDAEMIRTINERKTVRITIVNYDTYQNWDPNSEPIMPQVHPISEPSALKLCPKSAHKQQYKQYNKLNNSNNGAEEDEFHRSLEKYVHMHSNDVDRQAKWDLLLFETCRDHEHPFILQVAHEAFKKRIQAGEQSPKIYMEQLVTFLEQKNIMEQNEDDPAQTHANLVLSKGTGIALWDSLGSEACLVIAAHHGLTVANDGNDANDANDECYQFKQWYRKQFGESGHTDIQHDFHEKLMGSYEHGLA